MTAAAQRFADIGAKGTDICALRAIHVDFHPVRRQELTDTDVVNLDGTGFTLDLLAFSGQFIQFFAVDLHCGIHGRHLFQFTDKRSHHFTNSGFVEVHFFRFQNFAGSILCCGRNAQSQHGTVAFSTIHDDIGKLCCLTHTDRQNAFRIGVKGACVAHLFHVDGSAHDGNYVMGSKPFFFVNIENTVQKEPSLTASFLLQPVPWLLLPQ